MQAFMHRHLIEGLIKKGLKVAVWDSSHSPQLTVESGLPEYSRSTGFWTGGVQIRGTLKAIAMNDGRIYDRM